MNNIKTAGCLIPLILLVRMIDSIPWWSFAVVVLLFGVVVTLLQWRFAAFTVGFVAGFLVWAGANIYYSMTLSGSVFSQLGQMLYLPGFLIIPISSILGGLITGIALYTGRALVRQILVISF